MCKNFEPIHCLVKQKKSSKAFSWIHKKAITRELNRAGILLSVSDKEVVKVKLYKALNTLQARGKSIQSLGAWHYTAAILSFSSVHLLLLSPLDTPSCRLASVLSWKPDFTLQSMQIISFSFYCSQLRRKRNSSQKENDKWAPGQNVTLDTQCFY